MRRRLSIHQGVTYQVGWQVIKRLAYYILLLRMGNHKPCHNMILIATDLTGCSGTGIYYFRPNSKGFNWLLISEKPDNGIITDISP